MCRAVSCEQVRVCSLWEALCVPVYVRQPVDPLRTGSGDLFSLVSSSGSFTRVTELLPKYFLSSCTYMLKPSAALKEVIFKKLSEICEHCNNRAIKSPTRFQCPSCACRASVGDLIRPCWWQWLPLKSRLNWLLQTQSLFSSLTVWEPVK